MKIKKTASGLGIELTESEWRQIGKQAGWDKSKSQPVKKQQPLQKQKKPKVKSKPSGKSNVNDDLGIEDTWSPSHIYPTPD